MKINKLVCIVSILLLAMAAAASGVSAVTMDVGEASGEANATIQIPVTVDVSTGIAGAAFTITYDTSKIELNTIESDFFGTFASQWIGTPNQSSAPTSVTVDSVTYTQPVLSNEITTGDPTGTMVAAARCTPGPTGTNTTLFMLSFTLKEGARSGIYQVGVTSSTINNTDAGYDEEGEKIPMLIGANAALEPADPLAYPVLLDPENSIGTVLAGSVTFTGADVDSDGIGDDWEQEYFGNITTASSTSDYDQDGYSDLQEYLNSDLTDANGDAFDPVTWKNAPGSTGYNAATRVAPGDLDNNSDVSLDDVRATFTIFLGGPFTPQEFAAANVCDDGDGNSTISLNDVKGAFTLFLGGVPCQ